MSKSRASFGKVKFYNQGVQNMLKSQGVESGMKNIGNEIKREINSARPEYNMTDTVFAGPRRKRVWIGTTNPSARYREAYDGIIRRATYKKRG